MRDGITNALDGRIYSAGDKAAIGGLGSTGSGGAAAGGSSGTARVLGFDRDEDFDDFRLLVVTVATTESGGKTSSGTGGSSDGVGSTAIAGLPGTGVDDAVVVGVQVSRVVVVVCFTSSESVKLEGISSNSKITLGLPFSRYWLT